MKFKQTIILLILFNSLFAYNSNKKLSDAFINVAKIGNPTIVSIISEKTMENNFHYFFDNHFQEKPKGQSLGSGVIIDAQKGYIITNNHVIDGAEEIKVILFNRQEIDAKIIATDPLSDIAIIQVHANNLTAAPIGNSENLNVGEWIVAIGSPFGLHLNHTVTAGIISAIGRNDVISRNNFEDFIQHDAAINPGNSGGGLFDLNGKLIGINTAIATDGFSRGNAGVGFAIPINMVKRIMSDLISDGKVSRGWLGVQIQDLNSNMAKALGLKNRNGAIISHIIHNSPAYESELKTQDVVIAVNDKQVHDSSKLKNLISSGRPNEKTKLTIIRNGKEKNLHVTLGTRPEQNKLAEVYQYEKSIFDLLGLITENHNIDENGEIIPDKKLGILIIDIDPKSASSTNNLKIGDIIIEIGKTKIENIDNYNEVLSNYIKGDTIMLLIIRNKTPLYIAFEIQ